MTRAVASLVRAQQWPQASEFLMKWAGICSTLNLTVMLCRTYLGALPYSSPRSCMLPVAGCRTTIMVIKSETFPTRCWFPYSRRKWGATIQTSFYASYPKVSEWCRNHSWPYGTHVLYGMRAALYSAACDGDTCATPAGPASTASAGVLRGLCPKWAATCFEGELAGGMARTAACTHRGTWHRADSCHGWWLATSTHSADAAIPASSATHAQAA